MYYLFLEVFLAPATFDAYIMSIVWGCIEVEKAMKLNKNVC